MITKRNIRKHEWIGKSVRVVKSTHPGYLNIEGKIVDESKNMLHIEHGNKVLRIPKKCISLEFNLNGKKVVVDCSTVTYRPEDRTKKCRWGVGGLNGKKGNKKEN